MGVVNKGRINEFSAIKPAHSYKLTSALLRTPPPINFDAHQCGLAANAKNF